MNQDMRLCLPASLVLIAVFSIMLGCRRSSPSSLPPIAPRVLYVQDKGTLNALAVIRGEVDNYEIEVVYDEYVVFLGKRDTGLARIDELGFGIHNFAKDCVIRRRAHHIALLITTGDGGHSERSLLLIENGRVVRRWYFHEMEGPESLSELSGLPRMLTESPRQGNTTLWDWIDRHS